MTKPIAVLQGAPSEVIQALMRDFARGLAPQARIAGVVEEPEVDFSGEVCGGAHLLSLADGRVYEMYQDLGASSGACRLDAAGVVTACEAVERDIAAGCDLVVLNKFGKVEMERSGLASAFAAAIDARIPVITSVSPKMMEHWDRFAAPLYEVLPPDAGALERWWLGASSST